MKPLIYCVILSQILFSSVYAYQEQDLDALSEKLQYEEDLNESDKKIIDKLWQKYVAGSRLTIHEDDTVYKYEQWMNRNAELTPSPVDPNWVVYSRFGLRGWQFVTEHKVKNGIIYELEGIQNRKQPFFQWASKTLKLVWETGPSTRTNLYFYDQQKDVTKSIVLSSYKDFAPHFTPLEEFILFLSNRDRKSRNDSSYALYAINLENLSEVLKLTVQQPFAPPTGGDPIIKFYDNNQFDIQLVDGSKTKYELNKLVSTSRQKIIEANKKHLAKIEEEKKINQSKIKQSSFELILDSYEFKDSNLKLVKELNNIILKDVARDSKDYKILMSTTQKNYKAIPGLVILPSKDKVFFIKLNNNKNEIWQYEGYGRQPKRISPKGENCYGMQIDETSNTFVYLLQRVNSFHLVAIDSRTATTLKQYKINKPLLDHGEDLTKILNRDKIYFRDQNGNWKTVEKLTSIKTFDNKAKEKPELSFHAPHLPKIAKFIIKKSKKSNVNISKNFQQSIPSISEQIESLRKSIQWISTNEELEVVMSSYNDLHSIVTQKIKEFKDSNSFSEKRLKIRWIESLNGIKALLDNAKLLLEVE